MDIDIDYYELLHVQPSAPEPVIKASYRAMMQKLKHHPDKGGDVEFAQLLNDAAKTLCNPDTRAQYDALRREYSDNRKSTDTTEKSAAKDWGEPGGSPTNDSPPPTSSMQKNASDGQTLSLPSAQQCPFCLLPYPSGATPYASNPAYANSTRCKKCNGATTPITKAPLSNDDELRRIHRQSIEAAAKLWIQWPQQHALSAKVTDFSPAGCAMRCQEPIEIDRIIMIETELFNAICRVKHGKPFKNQQWVHGLSFVTLEMHSTPGSLLNATA